MRKTDAGVPYVVTPATNFSDVRDFPYEPNYVTFEGMRLHYVDTGPRHGPVALLMHGMPTWSYLNRHIIRALTASGWRCIAADHIGFGKSDKVTDDGWYSIARHTAAHRALIESLDLGGINLFCQDWGGPIGLAQAALMPERVDRLVIMNTWLHHPEYEYTQALRRWNAAWQIDGLYGRSIPGALSLGDVMAAALGFAPITAVAQRAESGAPLLVSPEQAYICAAYDAPFIGSGHPGHAGPRRFPLSLPFDDPVGGNADAQARHFAALLGWRKPVHFIWGGQDRVFTEAWGRAWAGRFPQATFDLIPDAGHFLQETHGAEVARLFLERAGAGRLARP